VHSALFISFTLSADERTVDFCKRRCLEEENLVVGGGVVISVNMADGFRDQVLNMQVVKAVPIQASRGALRAPGYCDPQNSRQSAHEGGKVSPKVPSLPSRKYPWYSFLLEAESTPRAIVRPEGLCQ
jgi:hypothetical protein